MGTYQGQIDGRALGGGTEFKLKIVVGGRLLPRAREHDLGRIAAQHSHLADPHGSHDLLVQSLARGVVVELVVHLVGLRLLLALLPITSHGPDGRVLGGLAVRHRDRATDRPAVCVCRGVCVCVEGK